MSLKMTKRIEWDAGHRLLNHESKCANAHGHRYALETTLLLTGSLDIAGRIVDFGDVKRLLGRWIDEHLDHAFIVNVEDKRMLSFLVQGSQKHYVMAAEPSAENLAVVLLEVAARLLDVDGARRVVRVVLWETPTSSAEATR